MYPSFIEILDFLKVFKEKQSQIKEFFMKSDHVGCYHNGQSQEALYSLCKKSSVTLKRFDFNEPSRRKDQCDKENRTPTSLYEFMLAVERSDRG